VSDTRPVVDPEFRDHIPPLAQWDYVNLELAVLADGCREPLVVWAGKNILLDGHNRLEICERHGIPYQVVDVALPDREAAFLWMEENQLARRNLNDDQRAVIVRSVQLRRSRAAVREQRAIAGKASAAVRRGESNEGEHVVPLVQSDHPVRTDLSREYKISQRKLKYVAQLDRDAPELLPKVRSGEMGLAEAIRFYKKSKLVAELEEVAAREIEAPSGTYDVIVIDPPWPMEKIERDCRQNQAAFEYPTMDEPELAALPIPCAVDCHVWLWTTQKFMPMAFRLLDAWGLKYVCTFVWHKPGGFQPIGLPQYNCEFVLYARRGAPQFVDTKAFPVCFSAPRGAHSEKPEEFYEIVRHATAGRRLDMFSRSEITGFTGWGNESVGS
jgi:N6-adenosine-specific RNA methylase IME4